MSDPGETTDPDGVADQLAALRADNARLRRLLDDAGAPDGLRHAFRDTLAMLRAMVRRSAECAEDEAGFATVARYAAHLEGRLDALARVRAGLDAFGEADLHMLVSDELLSVFVREGERATLDGPGVRLRPKAAQVLALAVHELASNAVAHGPLGAGDGRVDVTWTVRAGADAPVLALTWTEGGGTVSAGTRPTGPARRGFGTAVLEEMLAYDLGAQTTLAHAPDGARCAILLPLTARVGHVVEDADPPEASVP